MKNTNRVVIAVVGLLFILLGCLCSGTGSQPLVPTPARTPRATASGGTAVVKDFTNVRINKSDGALLDLLKAEANKAQGEKRHPYIEFDATWCGPCIAIRKTLDDGDPLMVDAFAGTYIIHVDIDEWAAELEGAGYNVTAIPIYYELDQDGVPTGRTIDGGAWGDNIPENMAPPLKKFFQAGAQ